MAHRVHIRAGVGSGAWSNGYVLGTEFEKFDAAQFSSIDGDAGGSWAPSSVILIGGRGLTVSGDGLTVSGPLTSPGAATFNGTLTANGAATFNGAVSFTAPGPVVVDAPSNIRQPCVLNAPMLEGTLGRVVKKCALGPDSNLDIYLADYTSIIIPPLSGSRSWNLKHLANASSAPLYNGDTIMISSIGTSFTSTANHVTVFDGAAPYDMRTFAASGTSYCSACIFEYYEGHWYPKITEYNRS